MDNLGGFSQACGLGRGSGRAYAVGRGRGLSREPYRLLDIIGRGPR